MSLFRRYEADLWPKTMRVDKESQKGGGRRRSAFLYEANN